jgi:hypothetical protein
MKTTKRNAKTNKTTGSVRHFTVGNARVLISDPLFGDRFLGGSDFIVFATEADGRQEISCLLSARDNSKIITSWEIQTWRGDGWRSSSAGENPAIAA